MGRGKKLEEIEIAPYTFDPHQFLQSIDDLTSNSKPKSSPSNKPLENPSSGAHSPARQNSNSSAPRNPSEPALDPEPAAAGHGNFDAFQQKAARSVQPSRAAVQKSFHESAAKGANSSRSENEYRSFAKEFDSEFGDHEREIAGLSKQLVSRIKKLQVLERELNSPNADVGMLRSRLAHDIESVEDELGEANHSIIVLMNERKNIKERFCTIRVKLNELTNYNKACQEKMRR